MASSSSDRQDSQLSQQFFHEATMKVEHPGSHFDHLIRQTRVHHQQLSAMVDSKASMLITISSLILTLSAPLLLEPTLKFVGIALMVSALITVLFASYAVLPKHISTEINPNLPGNNPSNILFFGHFVQMPYEEFERAWERLLNDQNLTYQVQVQEIYGLGQYLAKYKFRFVRYSYFSFITGILAAAFFAVVPILFNV
ncbi:MAG: hypothetical protein KDD70_12720 [Bdellovibrionales bacterium]|nr:hypothetical protein [Bdellovibrionales bacterium]